MMPIVSTVTRASADCPIVMQNPSAASKSIIRSFGHIQLCGVLHVCWQTKESVNGSYMVCLLYREWLCLAFATKMDLLYTIQACLSLSNISVEEVDNGRGETTYLRSHHSQLALRLPPLHSAPDQDGRASRQGGANKV